MKKFLLVAVLFLFATMVFAGERYLVVLKDNPLLLDSLEEAQGQNYADILKKSVDLRSKSIISKLESFNKKIEEGVLEDASEPVNYQKLWLINSLLIQGSKAVLKALKDDPNVAKVIKDFQVVMDDDNVGKVAKDISIETPGYEWGVEFLQAPRVWKEFGITGQNIVVGVLDTGVNAQHEALRGKIILYRDFANPNAGPSDRHGHGSHVAGIIAGGVCRGKHIGVAPDAKIIFGKVFDVSGKSFFSVVISALQWMSDPDGNPNTKDYPVAVNCSFRVPTPYGMTDKEVLDAFNKVARNLMKIGIIPVKSAGNSGGSETNNDTITMPGYSPYFLTVGALTPKKERAYFSSVGKPGVKKPDVMAPGYKIDSCSNVNNSGLANKSGTSMAAPHACGVIALVKAANPALSAYQIKKILQHTAHDIGKQGFDFLTGYGYLDAYAAVKEAIKKREETEAKINEMLNGK